MFRRLNDNDAPIVYDQIGSITQLTVNDPQSFDGSGFLRRVVSQSWDEYYLNERFIMSVDAIEYGYNSLSLAEAMVKKIAEMLKISYRVEHDS